jgi:hypothetical protein
MLSSNPPRHALFACAIVSLLLGCSGVGTPSSTIPGSPGSGDPTSVLRAGVYRISKPDSSPGFADIDATGKAAIIVSADDNIYVFSPKGKVIAKIAGVSGGLAGTKAGDFYVTNTAHNSILLYKSDYKTLLATLSDPNEFPVAVSYEETTGVVGVTNIVSTSNGPGTVSIYAEGKTTPCATVGNPAWVRVYFDAFDSKGDLFVDGEDRAGKTVVGEITGGCKANSIAPLKVGNVIAFPGAVQVTKTDDVAVSDQEGGSIYTYKPPVQGSLGAPIATTPLTGSSDVIAFAFGSNGKDLWTADAVLGVADEYAYPAGGSPVFGIAGLTAPDGIVVMPVDVP